MAVASKEVRKRILHDKLATPVLDLNAQLAGDGSFDVRLGHQFLVFNKVTGFSAIDPTQGPQIEEELRRHHQRMIRVGHGHKFTLHPRDFVIARTFEYISMPKDWIAYVVGRSSWGRLGLVIATATLINPGFKGTITLEIANLGQVPVVLLPLMRIAQLVFHEVRQGDDWALREPNTTTTEPNSPRQGTVNSRS